MAVEAMGDNLHDKGATLALLIDGDNASQKIVAGLLAEVAKYGAAGVRRIYGDWTKPNLGGWKACLLEHSIQPIQQFAYTTGKNATDGAMIIDAMDLLYTGRFDGFWEFGLAKWDVAAGILLIEEAGGKVSDFAGNPYQLGGPVILATNGLIHEEMRAMALEISRRATAASAHSATNP